MPLPGGQRCRVQRDDAGEHQLPGTAELPAQGTDADSRVEQLPAGEDAVLLFGHQAEGVWELHPSMVRTGTTRRTRRTSAGG
jgi:hypothetical protein